MQGCLCHIAVTQHSTHAYQTGCVITQLLQLPAARHLYSAVDRCCLRVWYCQACTVECVWLGREGPGGGASGDDDSDVNGFVLVLRPVLNWAGHQVVEQLP